MENTLFSIILPTYNRALMIGKAIESVIAQEYTHWELLVVDDGSTDNTKVVVEAYNDARIRYIYQQNAERSAARNNGIANAKGTYVCFIDSDDYYFPNHLSAFNKAINEKGGPVAMFFCNTAADIDGVVTKEPVTLIKTGNNIEFFILNVVGIPRACLHIDIVKKHNFNKQITIGEDMELWVRIARDYPFYYVDEYTQAYTEHAGRSVAFSSVKPIIKSMDTLRFIFSNFSLNEISRKVRAQSLSYGYFRIAQFYQLEHNYFKMVGALLNSTFKMPSFRFKEKVYMVIKGSVFGKLLTK